MIKKYPRLSLVIFACLLAHSAVFADQNSPSALKNLDFQNAASGLPFAGNIPIHLEKAPEARSSPISSIVIDSNCSFSLEDLTQIENIAGDISKTCVDPVDKMKLFHATLKGMVSALKDPFSCYYTPDEFKKFMGTLNRNSASIGIVALQKEIGHALEISYVFPGTPADKANLKPGDQILEIDGMSVPPLSHQQVGARIMGPNGSLVNLKVLWARPQSHGAKESLIQIQRAEIKSPNEFSKMVSKDVGYIYFRSFNQGSPDIIAAHARKLLQQGMRSLIIDIRGNGGGLRDCVKDLLCAFLSKGQRLMTEVRRNNNGLAISNNVDAEFDGEFKDIPLKILVNEESASASEIFAGAIQDNKRGVIIGSQTFGKGTEQTITPLKDGSALRITTARWYTPSGRSIQRDDSGKGGITPDIVVNVSKEEKMEVMEKILLDELSGIPPQYWSEDARKKMIKDSVLEKALETK